MPTSQIVTESSEAFDFWLPQEGYALTIGPDDSDLPLPLIPIPIKTQDFFADSSPSEKAIGDGLYTYLCSFPDCDHGQEYAYILKQAYPFIFSDIAAELLVLDVKDVDSEGGRRKLALLKILLYLDAENFGLLFKAGVACHDLSLSYAEIFQAESHLQQARAYFERARKLNPAEPANLNFLGQVCYLQGSYHQAKLYWQLAIQNIDDQKIISRLQYFLDRIESKNLPEFPLVKSLNMVAVAAKNYEEGFYSDAHRLMESIAEEGSLPDQLPNPEFYYLLGLCREKCHNISTARQAFEQALTLEPTHPLAIDAIDRVNQH